jgi:hypothetical protein
MSDSLDRRVRFIEYVCGLLHDKTLRTPLTERFMAVPSAFWSAPASSTGKHHPSYALGDGGLLRHTLVCLHVARDLAAAYGLTSDRSMDVITIAAAFHDTYKGGDTGNEPWIETVTDHPIIGRDHLLVNEPSTLNAAASVVWYHMSMWGPTPTPMGSMAPIASVVSSADYIASRKYLEPSAELAELLADFQ